MIFEGYQDILTWSLEDKAGQEAMGHCFVIFLLRLIAHSATPSYNNVHTFSNIMLQSPQSDFYYLLKGSKRLFSKAKARTWWVFNEYLFHNEPS